MGLRWSFLAACGEKATIKLDKTELTMDAATLVITFPPACRGLGLRLRWPLTPSVEGKAVVESGKHEQLMVLLALTGRGPDSGPCGLSPCCLMDLVCKCDVLFPLPVEEKAVFWIPRNARDCLFLLPVE